MSRRQPPRILDEFSEPGNSQYIEWSARTQAANAPHMAKIVAAKECRLTF